MEHLARLPHIQNSFAERLGYIWSKHPVWDESHYTLYGLFAWHRGLQYFVTSAILHAFNTSDISDLIADFKNHPGLEDRVRGEWRSSKLGSLGMGRGALTGAVTAITKWKRFSASYAPTESRSPPPGLYTFGDLYCGAGGTSRGAKAGRSRRHLGT